MGDYVVPDTRTLGLSGEGRTITIRKRLNYGERTAMYARMAQRGVSTDDGRRRVDGLRMEGAIITAFLLDWTLRYDDGTVIPIKGLAPDEMMDVINALEPETVTEIRDAIDAHAEREEQARLEEKKLPASASA